MDGEGGIFALLARGLMAVPLGLIRALEIVGPSGAVYLLS